MSLRRRWNRTFGVLITFLVIGGLVSLAGTALLLDNFRNTAVRTERDGTISATLRADIVAYSITVTSVVIDPSAVNAALARTDADFARAVANQHDATAKLSMDKSRQAWEALVSATTSPTHDIDVNTRGAVISSEAPKLLAQLDQAGAVGRAAVRVDVARAAREVREALALLAVLGLVAIAVTVRLARRLSTEVLQPVGILRDSANHLAAGELDHRIVVDREDELGDLAISFNAMADAIAGVHRSLELEATTDSLSGLANRAAFRARLEAILARPERRAGSQAVLFVDLDDFKDVNDTLGHDAGDALLRVVAGRLNQTVRPGDLVGRLGGDEFAILLDGLADPGVAFTVAERIVAALSDSVDIAGSPVRVGASVGLTMVAAESTVAELLREADVAMYAAKGKGKNRVERYDAELADIATARQALRADVVGVAERGELVLGYQPVVDLDTGAVVGLEALVRWQHPTRGLLPPSEFIDLAESTGAINGIGASVLEQSCQQLAGWQRRYGLADLWLSVNVSVLELDRAGYASQVRGILRRTGVLPTSLVLEVTETVLADPAGVAVATLSALRGPGVRVALDDFGTGYSSLSSLSQLPVDIIKIDRSFVSGRPTGAPDDAVLEAIVAMGDQLGLLVIPEGIETSDQLSRLVAMGCRVGQGFHLSRPVSATAIGALFATPQAGAAVRAVRSARLASTPGG